MSFNKPIRQSLSIKIFALIIVIVSLQATVFYIVASIQLKEEQISEKTEDVQAALIGLQETLQYLSAKQEMEQIQKTLASLGAGIDTKKALLLDQLDNVIASKQISDIGKNIDNIISLTTRDSYKQYSHDIKIKLKNKIWLSKDNLTLYAISPITLGQLTTKSIRSDKFGTLFLEYDLMRASIQNQNRLNKYFIPEILLLLITGLGLAVYFNLSITQRIKAARDSAAQFPKTDYRTRINITGNDEITDLGMAFNAMAREVQEQHKELLKRKQNLQLYRAQTPLAFIEWNADFQVIDWNKAAEKMFGYKLNEVEGRNYIDLLLPECSDLTIKEAWEELIENTGITIENSTKDGHFILCEWHNTTLKNDFGAAIGAASLVQDVTLQNKMQRNIVVKQQEQRDILNSMLDAVITIDEKGIIRSFNRSAERLFAYSSEEIIGLSVNQIMPNTYDTKHNILVHDHLTTGRAATSGLGSEIDGQRKNKHTFPIRVSVVEFPVDDNGQVRFIIVCQDLTEIKQQEEQLRHSQKMDTLGMLTGGIAHDFNNILGIIMGYSDLLIEMLTDNPTLTKYASEIHHAGERGTKLTNKLLSISHDKTQEASMIDINTLLSSQEDMLQKTLTVRVKLLIELGEKVWPIWLDRNDLEDAILNISINALHAMEGKKSGAQLTIRTSNQSLNFTQAQSLGLKAGDFVQLIFTDTGTSMDTITKEKMYEPFFTTKGEKGSGLGLLQVLSFIKRAKGGIKVNSQLGFGTELIIYFPRHIHLDNEETSNPTDYKLHLDGEESILIVDDESSLLTLTSDILERQGYHTICATNAKQALDILKHHHVDLMLSDIIMPEMDGYQLASIVQKEYPAVTIQLASGFDDQKNKELVDKNLAINLLYKPYKRQVLLKTIRFLLDNKISLSEKTGGKIN